MVDWCVDGRVEISEQLVVSLSVAESMMEDAGEYAVRVYNEYGEVTSTTQVNILFEAPTFTVPLTDQQVRQCARYGSYYTIYFPVTSATGA